MSVFDYSYERQGPNGKSGPYLVYALAPQTGDKRDVLCECRSRRDAEAAIHHFRQADAKAEGGEVTR